MYCSVTMAFSWKPDRANLYCSFKRSTEHHYPETEDLVGCGMYRVCIIQTREYEGASFVSFIVICGGWAVICTLRVVSHSKTRKSRRNVSRAVSELAFIRQDGDGV